MTSRNEICDPIMRYQHQKSHYEHLYNPRSTYRISVHNRKLHSLHHNTKTSNEKQRVRKIENKKILLSLLDIYNNKPGILSKNYQESCHGSQPKRRNSSSSYKKQHKEKQIQRENKQMFQSLVNAEPSIGNKKEWTKHFQQHLEMEKKLMNHANKEKFNLKQFKEGFSKDKHKKLFKIDRKQQKIIEEKEPTQQHETVSKREQRKKKKKKLDLKLSLQDKKQQLQQAEATKQPQTIPT